MYSLNFHLENEYLHFYPKKEFLYILYGYIKQGVEVKHYDYSII